MLSSCETVSNLADKVSPSDDSSDTDNQLLSDELGKDPTLEEILADAEINFEETNFEDSDFVSDDELEIAEEKLPANPTTEYDTTLIESNESSDLINEEDTISDLVQEEDTISNLGQEELMNETIDPPVSQEVTSFDKTFERSKLDLDEQIQYRVATINFSSGSSSVNNSGLKKIKKILRN